MGFDYSCYDPCRDKTGKRWIGYYLTAYNIAVKHGFVGTEEEWLESLQGKSVMLRYNAETETLQWAYENTDDWKDILDINDLRSEIVAQTLDEANAAKTGAETAQGKAESAQEAAESAKTAAETAKGLAETAASDAASSAGAAEGSAGSAASSAQSAAQSAQSAMEYAGKPSKVEDGTWRVWNAASQAYTDTGVKAYTNPMGAYDPDTAYSLLDVVSYEGASYLALKDVQGVTPSSDGTSWMLLADKGDTGLSVESVVKTGGTGAPGTTDTYTVYLTDNTPVGTITVYNGQDGAGDFKADGSVPMTGDLQMAQHKVTGLAEGTADTDGVNKGQMDAAIAALTGEDIPTSGTDETTIATALSNKADKGPPQVYDLPVADGYTVAVDGAGYSKTQEGIVCVYFSVNGNFEASASDIGGDAFATLPEGFRPTGKIPVPVVQQDIPGPDWVKVIVHPDGSMRYYGNGSTTTIYGSVSFVASA